VTTSIYIVLKKGEKARISLQKYRENMLLSSISLNYSSKAIQHYSNSLMVHIAWLFFTSFSK